MPIYTGGHAVHLHFRVWGNGILYKRVMVGETSTIASKAYLKQLLPRVFRDLEIDTAYSDETKVTRLEQQRIQAKMLC